MCPEPEAPGASQPNSRRSKASVLVKQHRIDNDYYLAVRYLKEGERRIEWQKQHVQYLRTRSLDTTTAMHLLALYDALQVECRKYLENVEAARDQAQRPNNFRGDT